MQERNMHAKVKIPHDEKVRRFREALAALGINPRQAASRMRKSPGMCYQWHCGSVTIPNARLEQVEGWVEIAKQAQK